MMFYLIDSGVFDFSLYINNDKFINCIFLGKIIFWIESIVVNEVVIMFRWEYFIIMVKKNNNKYNKNTNRKYKFTNDISNHHDHLSENICYICIIAKDS